MRVIGSMPTLRFSRNPGLALLGLLVVFYLAYQTAQLVIAGDVNTLAMSGLTFVAVAIVVAILNDWRRGLYFLLGWILFEDFFRKYLGNNMAIFFAKDALAVVLYLAFFAAKRKNLVKSFRPPFLVRVLRPQGMLFLAVDTFSYLGWVNWHSWTRHRRANEILVRAHPYRFLKFHVRDLGRAAGFQFVRGSFRGFRDRWTGHSLLTPFLFRKP